MQPTIKIDYNGLPVNHPTETVTFVREILAQQGRVAFGIDFKLSDIDRKLVRLNKTDLKGRQLWLTAGLEILFNSPRLGTILKSPEKYADAIYGYCVFPRRERFEPDKVHTFCLVRNHHPELEVKVDFATDELSGIKAETGGKIFTCYDYGISSISHTTIVTTLIPAILSRLAVEVVSGRYTDDAIFEELFDLSKYYLVVG